MATYPYDPDPYNEVDPFDKLQKGLDGLHQKLAQAEFSQNVGRQIEQYKASHADYSDRLNYLLESRAKDMISLGLNDEQVSQALNQEAVQVAIIAHQQGRNPAELVSMMAENRGYSGKGRKEASGDPWVNDKRGLSEAVDPWMEGQPTFEDRQRAKERDDWLNAPERSIFEE